MKRPGYIDPTLGKPVGLKERELYAAVRAKGLTLRRLHARGTAVRLSGPGVHVLAASVSALTLNDTEPKNDL